MKILYVTSLWSGFRDILFEGAKNAKGMPAFINPLKRLVELGHEVDIVVTDSDISNRDLNILVHWLDKSRISLVDWNSKGGVNKCLSMVRVCCVINHKLRSNKYDFVYGHGSIGALANIVAKYHCVPSGIRLYGSFLITEINKFSKMQIAIRHPLEYLVFKLPKDFLLITNDGSKGDEVYNYLTNQQSKYKFYFMLNGVDLPIQVPNQENISIKQVKSPFILYPARIARWKRQHLALEILKSLHDNGFPINLYFAGHITDLNYWNQIKERIVDYGLESFVTYLGTVDRSVLFNMYKKAMVVMSLYEVSNMGNVVIEALQSGAIVMSLNDGSLQAVIVNGQNGILIDNPHDAVNEIKHLINDNYNINAIRERAEYSASELFKDWTTRAEEEIQLIQDAVSRHES